MIDELRQVCALQPQYSPENTPPMQERSRLIRQALPAAFRGLENDLRAALGGFADTFTVGASDGIGRKTEAPWVRICAASMSPTPRDGFYVVVHFAADGSAVFVTIGCGSTIWANGELRAVSDEELTKRRAWARSVLEERFGSIAPFTDEIRLGARAALPKTFEKATAVAKRIEVSDLDDDAFRYLLIRATRMLRALYHAQRQGSHLNAATLAEAQLEAISRPSRAAIAGQGFRLSAAERKAVELRAMEAARGWLESAGYRARDVSGSASFDFEALKSGDLVKVEVKGTTGEGSDAIFMTKNEVDLHTSERGRTGIIIVSNIKLDRRSGEPVGLGGDLFCDMAWDIEAWDKVPMAFKLVRKLA
ncbi:MrcB family domain-containing protein [Phenylobacterium montanum]|uniref:DUF3578 domain-containing protein n=1 Tax=Phenylobacterium montanum TaxID=2823693 RepID=A0A975FZ34_9CAUL|nr:DUF3578 domain-containing protein [Caulobacter sp. S6]QUD86966.1 DUF3578 domain-containing protein [Caulobacter sp. S6]